MKLGDIIHSYRENHDMSMGEFAKLAGVSKAYVGFLEKGINPKTGRDFAPSIKTIQSVANAMRMDFDELFNMLDGEVTLKPAAEPSSGVRAESKGFSDDKSLHLSKSNEFGYDKPLHQDESNGFYDTDRLLAEVRKYGTDTPEQRAALSAALDSMPIPDDKRELMKNVLQMDPEQAAAFLAFAKTVVKRP